MVLVVGYLQEQIREFCGDEFQGKRIQYVEQENFSGGTGDALMCAKDLVCGKFICMNADDIHGAACLSQAIEYTYAVIGTHSDEPHLFGVLSSNKDGTLHSIDEKPENPTCNIVNTGTFVLDEKIFTFQVPKNEAHDELFLTDMVIAFAREYSMQIISQDQWIPVGKPEDIQIAEAQLCPEK